MNLLVPELLKILAQELKAYRQMLALLGEEREAIARASLQGLLRTNREKETLLTTIEELEREREILIGKLATFLEFSPEHLTLSFLAQQIEGPLSFEVESYQQQLSCLIEAAAEINSENARLLQHSRNIITQLMAILNSQGQFSPLYLPDGTMQPCSPLKRYNRWQV